MSAFSVLLPVYAGDEPGFFARALASVTSDQTVRPDQLVIVRDGPVPAELETLLADAERGEGVDRVPTVVVRMPHNHGLAEALTQGLAACEHQIVARADADDISLPERFARQLPLLDGTSGQTFDLAGTAIREFETDERHPGTIRRLPSDANQIRKLARFRDPFNHPTVMFRKLAVAEAGGYEHLAKMEDYWLFARMLMSGTRATNLPDPLVLYRVGAGAYNRRGGLSMLDSEVRLQRAFWRTGFVTPIQALRNVAVRGSYRLIPTAIRQQAYRTMMRSSKH